MISRCSVLVFISVFIFSGCGWWDESRIPEDQAKIIRQILRANGINIGDKDWVDGYLYIDPYYHDIDHQPNETYWILLPERGKNSLVLTDEITVLTNTTSKFNGIWAYNNIPTNLTDTGTIDTLIIITDSLIIMRDLSVFLNKLSTLPSAIQYLRVKSLDFRYNHITHLPEDIIKLTTSPVVFDSFHVYLQENEIDTINVSDSLDNWLQTFSGLYWKLGQHP